METTRTPSGSTRSTCSSKLGAGGGVCGADVVMIMVPPFLALGGGGMGCIMVGACASVFRTGGGGALRALPSRPTVRFCTTGVMATPATTFAISVEVMGGSTGVPIFTGTCGTGDGAGTGATRPKVVSLLLGRDGAHRGAGGGAMIGILPIPSRVPRGGGGLIRRRSPLV